MMLRCQYYLLWLPNSCHYLLLFSSDHNFVKFLWLGIKFVLLALCQYQNTCKEGHDFPENDVRKGFCDPFQPFLYKSSPFLWFWAGIQFVMRHDLGIRRGSFCPMTFCVDQNKTGRTSLLFSLMGLVYQKWWFILGISDFASLIWDMWRKLGTRIFFSSVTYHLKKSLFKYIKKIFKHII